MLRVRTEGAPAPGEVRDVTPEALRAEGGTVPVSAKAEIAAGPHRALAPLPRALVEDAEVRDALATGIPVPSLAGLGRVRAVTALLAAYPLIVRLLADRAEPGHLALDVVLVVFVARELAARTPRRPRLAAVALLSLGLRSALDVARVCAKGVPASTWLGCALALVAGALWLVRAPTVDRVALELAGKLGLARTDLARARPEEDVEAGGPLVGGAIAAAVALPLALAVARRAGLALLPQAALLVAYAVVVPEVVRRLFDRGPGGDLTRARAHALVRPLALGSAVLMGLAAAEALVAGGDAFMKSGTELARCADKLDAEARRLVVRQAREIADALARVRASGLLAAVAVGVVPLAEERVYRGLLLPTLIRRYGRAYGLFATSLAFAVAHAGVYELAVWQTALLGLAFGLAWLEGGLAAAFATHAFWNLLQLV